MMGSEGCQRQQPHPHPEPFSSAGEMVNSSLPFQTWGLPCSRKKGSRWHGAWRDWILVSSRRLKGSGADPH